MTAYRNGYNLTLTDDFGTGTFFQAQHGENGLEVHVVSDGGEVDIELDDIEVEKLVEFLSDILTFKLGRNVILVDGDEYEAAHANAEQYGYARGYQDRDDEAAGEQTYADGYSDGQHEGYSEGHGDGYSDGEEAGYERGFEAGASEGYADGYAQGTSDERERADESYVF